MIKPVSQVEREVITTYLQSRWTRSHMLTVPGAALVPDPGWGKDEICPILYYGQPFDPSKSADVEALSAYASDELRGLPYYIADVQDGTWIGQQLSLRLKGLQWVLETLGGPVDVIPQSAVEPGATVVFEVVGGGDPDFTADTSGGYLHGVGFMALHLQELSAEGVDVGKRSSTLAQVQIRLMWAIAPPSAPKTADVYGAAVAALFRGVMWVADPLALEGDLLRDMADSGISIIRQYHRRSPIPERPTRRSEDSSWVWYEQKIIVTRQSRLPVAGAQSVTP